MHSLYRTLIACALAYSLCSNALASAEDPVPGTPFARHSVVDTHGRTITFYMDQSARTLPLAVIIQGSGCWSVFKKTTDGHISGWHQNTLYSIAHAQFHVAIVEKPGVAFLDDPANPGTAENCTDTFKQEQTLDRWRDALTAAVTSALSMPAVDSSRILVVGHSEGGIMSAALAAQVPAVTHVAMLSSNGPTQLFDMAALTRKQNENLPVDKRETAVDEIYSTYQAIARNPDSWTEMAWGHPYRRWSSFFATSAIEEASKSRAKIFLAQGTSDESAPIEAFDVQRAELVRRGRDVTIDRREGATHSLNKPGQTGPQGMQEVLQEVADWFLR